MTKVHNGDYFEVVLAQEYLVDADVERWQKAVEAVEGHSGTLYPIERMTFRSSDGKRLDAVLVVAPLHYSFHQTWMPHKYTELETSEWAEHVAEILETRYRVDLPYTGEPPPNRESLEHDESTG